MSDEHELEKIKRRKMAELIRMQKLRQEREERLESARNALQDKKQWLMDFVLSPQAKAYLEQVRARNPQAADRIEYMIFPPQVMAQLDLLVMLARRGRIPRGVIPVTEIQYLERKVLGIKSKIMVKKRGEEQATDLSSFLANK
ncbi:MAG: hypothetical protein ACTSU5_01490 [Promethearchaeota archaeon]